MGEVDASCCGDREVGRVSMCMSLLDSGEKGREILVNNKGEGLAGVCAPFENSFGEECERLSNSEKAGMLVDVDRVSDGCHSCGHEGLEDDHLVKSDAKVAEVVEMACSPCGGNVASVLIEDGLRALLEERKEVEEGRRGFLGAEEESEHLFAMQGPSIETQQMDKEEDRNIGHTGFENNHFANSDAEGAELMNKFCSSSCEKSSSYIDIGSSLEYSIKERNEAEEGCKAFVRPKEENQYLVVEQGSSVENVKEQGNCPTDLEIGHMGSNAEAPELVEGACCPSYDSGGSFSERKGVGEGSGDVLVADEDRGHLSLEDGPRTNTSKHIGEEEQEFFPSLSPLRISGGDTLGNSSEIDIGIERGDISGLYSDDKGCNRCEDALISSPVSVANCPLIKINGDSTMQADGFCCPPGGTTDASANFDTAWVDERCKNLIVFKGENLACSPCRENLICSNDGIGEEDKLFGSHTVHGLNISVGACIRQCEVDICGPSEGCNLLLEGGCTNKDVDRGFSGSRQGLHDEVAYFSAMDGSSSQQSSHLSSVAENCLSGPSLAAEFRENNSDAVNMTSTCCSDVKDSCGQVSDAGTVHQTPTPLIVFRRTNPKRAAASRNCGTNEKSDCLTRTRNSVQNGRKAVDANTSLSISMTKISKKAARKRSSLHRPPRHSLWGEADNLIRIFRQNDDLGSYDFVTSHTRGKRSKKGMYHGGKRKQQMAQKNGNFRLPKAKGAVSTNSVHIKDEIYLQPMCPGVGDSEASIQECNSLSVSNCHADSNIAIPVGEVCHKLGDGQFAIEAKLLQRDVQQGDKDLESTLTQETSVENLHGECPGISSRLGSEALVEPVNNLHLLDPGSSPDSDVYNPVADAGVITCEGTISTSQDAGTNQKVDDGLHASVSTSSKAIAGPVSASSLATRPRTYTRKGKKGKQNFEVNEQACILVEDPFVKERLHSRDNLTKAWNSSKLSKPRTKKKDVFSECSKSIKEATRKGLEGTTFPMECSVLGNAEMECGQESMKAELGSESCALSGQDTEIRQSEDGISGTSLVTDKIKGRRVTINSKPALSKRRPSYPDSAGRRRRDVHGQKTGAVHRSETNYNNQEKSDALDACLGESASLSLPSGMMTGSTNLSCDELPMNEASRGLEGQSLRKSAAWVSCDDCLKWRCISPELADFIEATKCRWTCKDNADKAFADCLIPQEKTNAEINAELEISGDEDIPRAKPPASQQSSWVHIKSNVFLHRNRKSQTIDEVMICQCKPPLDGSLGCGDDCLNRMLSIECVKGTCPCGNRCSNQQFQKRKYAKLESYPCGKKGYGLKLLEDVSQGQFLIEYVGEVLEIASYEARQRYYASRGQKHFYFMTLNNSEVIDACAKGNLGRFINHSCEPNCRTEKWMVNGEVCIGLFAIRDIKKDEEVTFDYNYVRVVGAAAKKCACGTSGCKGYIGGDPLNTEVIVQGDSDEEYIEPVMIQGDGLKVLDVVETVDDAMDAKVVKYEAMHEEGLQSNSSAVNPVSEACHQNQGTLRRPFTDVSPPDVSCGLLDPVQTEDTMSRPSSDVQLSTNSLLSLDNSLTEETTSRHTPDVQLSDVSLLTPNTSNESRSSSILSSKNSVSNPANSKQYASKPDLVAKSSRSTGTIKKSRSSAKNLVPDKTKKLPISASARHLEGVEQKLNELLDADGGISKRKDATKGYLKLLFVTAAEGDNVGGCASQSMRDLSLILDALLKTKSRMVLVDIINKNGLQMLHNIMKQNCSKFNRTPIIRKLLKVLEFLALKGILTPEHMNKGPPCSGMESFRDSILTLTRHNDMQVHHIARNFRDRWLPRTIKRVEPSVRDDGQLDSQRTYGNWSQSSFLQSQRDRRARDTNAIICVSKAIDHQTSSCLVDVPGQSSAHSGQVASNLMPLTDDKPTTGTTRKRKSRWDQPSDIMFQDQMDEAGSKVLKTSPKVVPSSEPVFLEQNFEIQKENSSFDEAASVKKLVHQSCDDEVPPGFGSRMDNHPQIPSRTLVATGYLQERYLPHLSVSFGIPMALVQQLGTPQVSGDHCQPSWAIAPGMPFHPFPPLPPYPRGEPNLASAKQSSSEHNMMAQGARETNLARRCHAEAHRTDPTAPSPLGERPADIVEGRPRNSQMSERIRLPSNNSGRSSFRPRRWNNQKFTRCWPPWPRDSNVPDSRGRTRNENSTWLPWPQESNDCGSRGSTGNADSTSPSWPSESNDRGVRGSTKNADPGVGIGNVKDIGYPSFSEGVSNNDVCS